MPLDLLMHSLMKKELMSLSVMLQEILIKRELRVGVDYPVEYANLVCSTKILGGKENY